VLGAGSSTAMPSYWYAERVSRLESPFPTLVGHSAVQPGHLATGVVPMAGASLLARQPRRLRPEARELPLPPLHSDWGFGGGDRPCSPCGGLEERTYAFWALLICPKDAMRPAE
jgi:hypothetical protein